MTSSAMKSLILVTVAKRSVQEHDELIVCAGLGAGNEALDRATENVIDEFCQDERCADDIEPKALKML